MRMEADWEFEVGGDAPVIEAFWEGFIDLRRTPQRARELPEAAQLSGLAAVLERLNSRSSPVWTSKCDVFPALDPEDFESDELDAPPGCFAHGMACYIDLLPNAGCQWSGPSLAEAECKHLCAILGAVPLRCCRVDFIVRSARIVPGVMDLGITAYITACGPCSKEAKDVLETALSAFANALCPRSTVQWESTGE
jgi:hypothetical protein